MDVFHFHASCVLSARADVGVIRIHEVRGKGRRDITIYPTSKEYLPVIQKVKNNILSKKSE